MHFFYRVVALSFFLCGNYIIAADFVCLVQNCTLKLPHHHEGDWLRIGEILCREQSCENMRFSNLVINLYDYLLKKNNSVPIICGVSGEELEELLHCLKPEVIAQHFPQVKVVDFGLYDPKGTNKCIEKLSLKNGEDLQEKYKILFVKSTSMDHCLDRPIPHDSLVAKLPRGLASGTAAGIFGWGMLLLKDYFLGPLLPGGHDFDAMSLGSFVITVGSIATLTVIIVNYFC